MSNALREAIEIILSLEQEELKQFAEGLRIMRPGLVQGVHPGSGKVINLTDRIGPSQWIIDVAPGHSDRVRYSYVGDDSSFEGAQWAIFLDTSSTNRISLLIEEAVRQISHKTAVRSAIDHQRSEGRT